MDPRTTWCDKLAATPAVGFKFDQHFAPSTTILDSLAPVLDKLVDREGAKFALTEKPRFTINRQDSFTLEFTTEDGFHYGADPSRVWVEFQHRMRVKPASGGPPVAELLSRPAPFSELLRQVSKRLLEATELIPEIGSRALIRVGVVASTFVTEQELPPGMARFIQYLGRPWRGDLAQYSLQLTADLDRNPDWLDRAAHTLIKPGDPEDPLTLRLDWSRTFSAGHHADERVLKSALEQATEASMNYFEDLAEGSRFDEEIIRSGS